MRASFIATPQVGISTCRTIEGVLNRSELVLADYIPAQHAALTARWVCYNFALTA
jgi:hypothetical protein